MKPRKYADQKHLEAAGYSYAAYRQDVEQFRDRGIDVGYVPRRGFRACKWGTPDKQGAPKYMIVWLGVGALVDYLRAPASLEAAFEQADRG